MKIHVLVEGKSEQILNDRWGQRAFPKHEVVSHAHQGKGRIPTDPMGPPESKRRGLLDLLPATLRAYGAASHSNAAVLVLVDADDDGCVSLKKELVDMAAKIRPLPKRLLFRIAVEETEAFYFGDLAGLERAFPSADMVKARAYKPDEVCRTAELFGEVVGDGGLNKVAWAATMGELLTVRPQGSRSPSFKAFHGAFLRLAAPRSKAVVTPPKRKAKKHGKSIRSAKRKAQDR